MIRKCRKNKFFRRQAEKYESESMLLSEQTKAGQKTPYQYAYPIVLCLLWCVGILPSSLGAACAPAFYGYQFLDPSLAAYDSQLEPFYAYFRAYYPETGQSEATYSKTDNLQEWYERYCEAVRIEDLERTIYGNSTNDLQRLLGLIVDPEKKTSSLPDGLRNNSFIRHLMTYRCTEVVKYLLFAKAVEPHVGSLSASTQSQQRRVNMERLLDQGIDQFRTTRSHYLRLRYAYQLLRLAHYLGEHAYVLELYDYLSPKIEADPSLIYYWMEGHRAGALQALGRYPEAAYLYSRIFANCRSRRESAYQSFRIRNDAEWQQTSNLCANDRERATLHVLRAWNSRAIVLEEMQSIYLLAPRHPALEPLLMRELRELEADLLGLDFNPEKRANAQRGRPRPGAAQRLIELQAFVNKVVDTGNTRSPQLWQLARGVIEMLGGDYFYARRSLAKAQTGTNDSIRQQAALFLKITDLLALNRTNDSIEEQYYNLLRDEDLRQQYPDLSALVNDKLETVYYQTGHRGKAGLLQYGFDAIQKNPDLSLVTELKNMGDSLLGNQFDKILLAERIGPDALDDINDLLGMYYLQRGQWEAALEVFKRIPAARRDAYGRFRPFAKQFHDRVNFRPSAAKTDYNKVELLEQLISLENTARSSLNDTIACQHYFNIGLAHYNMSYYSYNWHFADAFRSGKSAAQAARKYYPDWVIPHPAAPFGNRENFNMDRARYYFERALSRAPSREAAAEIIYYCAKTERNQNYAAARSRSYGYFNLLKSDYTTTRYYAKVVEECRTFAWFVGR